MTTRRQFVAQAAAATVTAMGAGRVAGGEASKPATPGATRATTDDRAYWCSVAAKLATPVLTSLADRKLKATMPVEAKNPKDRAKVTHLEALGRLLAGLAPWLELGAGDGGAREAVDRVRFAELAREGIDAATDPASPDYMNFAQQGQPLVDAAFLAEALLRAPKELWSKLPERVQKNVVAALAATRVTKPPEINWVLFASMVEAGMKRWGAPVDVERLHHGLERHRQWYLGDGMYGDGPEFHWDYYNAFVIQPMLVEVLDVVADDPQWKSLHEQAQLRLGRYAVVQERMVAPDGSYPIVGRSITYRCGAFQGLALAALRHALPKELPPAQARVALTAVIRKTLEAPGTFDAAGWLQLGVCGHQPSLAEPYISTGSLYLCSVALLPLGLRADDPFWADPPVPLTSQRVWSGADMPADHALAERHEKPAVSPAPPKP